MVSIEVAPGLRLEIDEDKFSPETAIELRRIPEGDYRLTLDLTLTNLAEKTEQKIQGLVILRNK